MLKKCIFTDYVFDRSIDIEEGIQVTICCSLLGIYGNKVKIWFMKYGLGLFLIGEFMGAIWHEEEGKKHLRKMIKTLFPQEGMVVSIFGCCLGGKAIEILIRRDFGQLYMAVLSRVGFGWINCKNNNMYKMN